ncbi:uncharacterized protein LOC113002940 [Solenopsis invicta]|uniref:uncharacterized protein LOC113002940 n=1 Tax=Solenopsis invicta TaxID=13686 RepID=UPI00193DE157|nr:uncharacterized protein LOC113002940 [Solenopsis invicta]
MAVTLRLRFRSEWQSYVTLSKKKFITMPWRYNCSSIKHKVNEHVETAINRAVIEHRTEEIIDQNKENYPPSESQSIDVGLYSSMIKIIERRDNKMINQEHILKNKKQEICWYVIKCTFIFIVS